MNGNVYCTPRQSLLLQRVTHVIRIMIYRAARLEATIEPVEGNLKLEPTTTPPPSLPP